MEQMEDGNVLTSGVGYQQDGTYVSIGMVLSFYILKILSLKDSLWVYD